MMKSSERGCDPRTVSRERMDAIGELAKRVSHDYNNLFGIVISAMSVLKEELSGNPEYENVKPFIDDAESAAREGVELMACLLASSGSQVMETAAVDPTELFEKIIEQTRSIAANGFDLEVALMPNPPVILANLERLQESIRALLNNAIDAMPNGGRLGISSAVIRRENADILEPAGGATRFLAFSVSDSGEGIEPDLLKRVCEPFFTTRNPEKRGLGLTLAYGYALQIGGCLCVALNPGGGVTATLWIPASDESDNFEAE